MGKKQMLLEDWFVTSSQSRVVGTITNDHRGKFKDGTEVMTSRIVAYKDGKITTISGSVYKLGKPSISLFCITPVISER